MVWFLIATLIACIASIVLVILECLIQVFLTDELLASAPHLNNFLGAYAMRASAVLSLYGLALMSSSNPLPIGTAEYFLTYTLIRIKESNEYYDRARFGTDDTEDYPYEGISKGIQEALSMITCKDEEKIPTTLEEAIECYDADNAFLAIESAMMGPLQAHFSTTNSYQIDANEPFMNTIWMMMIYPLYETYFRPTYDKIIPTIMVSLNSILNSYMTFGAICLIVGIITEV